MTSPLHLNTPLLQSTAYGGDTIESVLFKMDALQPSGSFKLRGIGRLCQEAVRDGAKAIVCASGGNAGFAAAFAGRALGVEVSIIVPQTTSREAQDAIRSAGATVIVRGAAFDDAHLAARDLAASTGAAYVHPFDHPTLWQGHATLIDEVVESGADFDCVVTSVGGGGLMLGIIEGLKRNGLGRIPVIAVETEGADSLHKSVLAGEPVTLAAITSIASSLGARRVADAAFAATRSHPVHSVTVSDAQAVVACARFADSHRVLVEPACGAAIAALDAHPALMRAFSRPLVEVCGGIGVSLARLAAWREAYGGSKPEVTEVK